MKQTIARHISQLLEAIENCQNRIDRSPNKVDKNSAQDWITIHRQTLENICKHYLPAGSGFDNGTCLDYDKSTPNKLVFYTSFHHMNSVGMYDGWTNHFVTVKPSFTRLLISIGGINRNDIKDTIHDAFDNSLETEVDI